MSDIFADYSFGGFLRRARINSGLTLRNAAMKLKIDAGNLSKLETSILSPPRKAIEIERICKILGIGSDLFKALAFESHVSELRKEFFE